MPRKFEIKQILMGTEEKMGRWYKKETRQFKGHKIAQINLECGINGG